MSKVEVIIWAVIVLVTALLFLDFKHAVTHNYWICDGGDKCYYTDEYVEEDGCVHYKNEYGSDVKQCGSYRIRKAAE